MSAGGVHQRAGKLRHHLHPALLAVFPFEDVLLSGGDEREAFGGFAGRPFVPVETVHQVAGDAVFLQHHGDGLRGVEGRVALTAALRLGAALLFDDGEEVGAVGGEAEAEAEEAEEAVADGVAGGR